MNSYFDFFTSSIGPFYTNSYNTNRCIQFHTSWSMNSYIGICTFVIQIDLEYEFIHMNLYICYTNSFIRICTGPIIIILILIMNRIIQIRYTNLYNSAQFWNKKSQVRKKRGSPLDPRYLGIRRIKYRKNRDTIQKSGLYNFNRCRSTS